MSDLHRFMVTTDVGEPFAFGHRASTIEFLTKELDRLDHGDEVTMTIARFEDYAPSPEHKEIEHV